MNDRRRIALLLLAALWLGCHAAVTAPPPAAVSPTRPSGPSFALTHVRVFDGERLRPETAVVVRDGRISELRADGMAPEGVPEIDGQGGTVLPGLIDAHLHLSDEAQLRQMLAFGVTTGLDMFTLPELATPLRKEQAQGDVTARADLRSAGTLVTAKGGHGTEYGFTIPTLDRPEDAEAFVSARLAEGSDYIKLVYDSVGGRVPTLNRATLEAAIAATHRHGKLAVVHAGTAQDCKEALEAGADGLVHVWRTDDTGLGVAELAKAKKAFVVPTLSVSYSLGGRPTRELVEDARISPLLSAEDKGRLAGSRAFPVDLAAVKAGTAHLAAAGVPLLTGSDAPNVGTTYGATVHAELAALVEAGLTPVQALVAATSAPAAAFHLDDRGRIAPGLRADLVLVKGDPTTEIKATREIVRVFRNGVPFDRAAYAASLKSTTPQRGGLVSDFEESELKARFGLGWQVSTDSIMKGKSVAQLGLIRGGANRSKQALEVTGTVAPPASVIPPWAGALFLPGDAPFSPVDVGAKASVRFWARGDGGTYKVMLFSQGRGRAPAERTFVATKEWKPFELPVASFDGLNGSDLTAVLFAGATPGAFRFQLDDVKLE